MATGEVGFSTRGQVAKRFVFEPVPAGDYSLKLDMSKAEAQKKEEPGSIPYLGGVRLEVLDTGTDGGPNRLVFHSLFTRISPTNKGNIAFNDAKGPLGLLHGLGVEADVPPEAVKSYPLFGEDGEPTGEVAKVVDPKWLKSYLAQYDGQVLQGHIKIRKQKDQDPRNEVAYFIAAESAGGDAGTFDTEPSGEAPSDAWGGEQSDLNGTGETEAELVEPEPVQTAPVRRMAIQDVPVPKPVQKKPAPVAQRGKPAAKRR